MKKIYTVLCQRENYVMTTNSVHNDPKIINTSYLIDLIQNLYRKESSFNTFFRGWS